MIETGIDNRSFPFLYDKDLKLVFVAYERNLSMYDLDGQLIKSFLLDVIVSQLAVTKKPSLLITTVNLNDLHEYDLWGQLSQKVKISGYHQSDYLLFDKHNSQYYLIYDLGWIYNMYSFDHNNKIIANIQIDQPDLFRWNFNLGLVTVQLLLSSPLAIQTYNQNMEIGLNLSTGHIQSLPMTSLMEFNSWLIYTGSYGNYVYTYYGQPIFNLVNHITEGISICTKNTVY